MGRSEREGSTKQRELLFVFKHQMVVPYLCLCDVSVFAPLYRSDLGIRWKFIACVWKVEIPLDLSFSIEVF